MDQPRVVPALHVALAAAGLWLAAGGLLAALCGLLLCGDAARTLDGSGALAAAAAAEALVLGRLWAWAERD